jgi:radical SAM protein with 4Fe4S-binding SPASM domain
MWYSPTPYCIFNPIAEGLGNKSCAACDGLLSIAPDGSILPCSSYDEPVGNLLSEPFAKLWRGKKSRFFKKRKYMPHECRGCEHTDICAGACPLYWQTEGTAELKNGK